MTPIRRNLDQEMIQAKFSYELDLAAERARKRLDLWPGDVLTIEFEAGESRDTLTQAYTESPERTMDMIYSYLRGFALGATDAPDFKVLNIEIAHSPARIAQAAVEAERQAQADLNLFNAPEFRRQP